MYLCSGTVRFDFDAGECELLCWLTRVRRKDAAERLPGLEPAAMLYSEAVCKCLSCPSHYIASVDARVILRAGWSSNSSLPLRLASAWDPWIRSFFEVLYLSSFTYYNILEKCGYSLLWCVWKQINYVGSCDGFFSLIHLLPEPLLLFCVFEALKRHQRGTSPPQVGSTSLVSIKIAEIHSFSGKRVGWVFDGRL